MIFSNFYFYFFSPQKYRLHLTGMLLFRLSFLRGRVACFHGPPCRTHGLGGSLEHTTKLKFAGETFLWLFYI